MREETCCCNTYATLFYMHHPDRTAHATAFVVPVVEHWLERQIAQWVHHKESIRLIPYKLIDFINISRCSSVVRAFVHGAMGRRINFSWGVTKAVVCIILSVG